MIISDSNIFYNGKFRHGSLETVDGIFTAVNTDSDLPVEGKPYVIPGLIDIHTHGCVGHDFSDADPDGIKPMAQFYASHGVTSFCPTSMTLPYETLGRAFRTALDYAESDAPSGSRIVGIHMEGPYFSEKKKGAQNGEYLKLPDIEGFKKLYEKSGELIRLVDIAPELEGAAEFAAEISKLCTVSVAHTDATYDEAAEVFRAGATHLTHLYNAMPQIHHRNPGVIGAAAEDEKVFAELICDGFHVHPSAVRMAFSLFADRICLISDSFMGAGMPDGDYELGGQPVKLKDGAARLENGTIAGSSANLELCLKKAIEFGIPVETAVKAATINPARSIGVDNIIGSIEPGKLADFVVCDGHFNIEEVYMDGKQFRKG